MNCHGNNSNENTKGIHSGISHMLMMVLCCSIPLILAVTLPFLGITPKFKIMLAAVTPFICPIMMFLMIPMMFMHSKENKSHNKDINIKKIKN